MKEDLGDGAIWLRGFLDIQTQHRLADQIWREANTHGWVTPMTPSGKPFSVRQMNFGPLGWVSDRRGYRYDATHPITGKVWPAIPPRIIALWSAVIGRPAPECCLVNHYTDDAKMGLHRDADEEDMDTPILSVSLGTRARFRLGGPARNSPTRSVILESGDIVILGGASRRHFHGIDRILSDPLFDTASFPFPGRLNITLRRVRREKSEPLDPTSAH